ncbi:MAG: hypothetical protein KAS73_05985 [Candidatus Sabulitectum sp.]|nr:hypothetical protein [Candidatus Sabulitectum sp.]
MTIRYLLIILALFQILLTGCDSTGPSAPAFELVSVIFTGDSIGASPEKEAVLHLTAPDGKSFPFLEMTLAWEKPVENRRQTFTIFRSTKPSIQSDLSEADELQIQLETVFADSIGLEWDSDYYYAVRAVDEWENSRWSNEVHVETPVSPFPEARRLSYEKHHFILCSLSWDKCSDESFDSYVLLSSPGPDIEHVFYNNDTLLVATDANTLSYTDSLPENGNERFYALVTVDKLGLTSYSNEIEVHPGSGIPWRVNHIFESGHDFYHEGIVSNDGTVMYLLMDIIIKEPKMLLALRTTSGNCFGSQGFDNIFAVAERSTGTIIASHGVCGDYSLSEYTRDLSSLVKTRHFDRRIIAIAEVPGASEILASNSYLTSVLDPDTFEPVDSLPYAFRDIAVSTDGSRMYLCGSRLVCLRSSDMEYLGEIDNYFNSVDFGLDEYLHCTTDNSVVRYDPYSLSPVDEFVFPFPVSSSILLAPEYRMIYLTHETEENENAIDVYDTITGNWMGRVFYNEELESEEYQFFLSSPAGEFLWYFTHDFFMMSLGYRVTI